MKIDLNKILEVFNGFNDQVRYSIFGAVVLLILFLDVFFLVLPQWMGIVDANAQIKTLSAETARVVSNKQRIDQFKKELDETRAKWQAMDVKVRPLQEVPAILGTISGIANDCGVKIDQLMPQKQGQESLKVTPEGHYYALPIVIQARCGYHMFGQFLNKLENGDLYFTLSDMTIQSDEKDPHTQLFSLTIKIILVDKTHGESKNS